MKDKFVEQTPKEVQCRLPGLQVFAEISCNYIYQKAVDIQDYSGILQKNSPPHER